MERRVAVLADTNQNLLAGMACPEPPFESKALSIMYNLCGLMRQYIRQHNMVMDFDGYCGYYNIQNPPNPPVAPGEIDRMYKVYTTVLWLGLESTLLCMPWLDWSPGVCTMVCVQHCQLIGRFNPGQEGRIWASSIIGNV